MLSILSRRLVWSLGLLLILTLGVRADFVCMQQCRETIFAEENLLEKFPAHKSGNVTETTDEKGVLWTVDAPSEGNTATNAVIWGVTLDQTQPLPIFISGESRNLTAQVAGLGGDYSLCVDAIYTDGTPEWGIKASFDGSKEWKTESTFFLPSKPIKRLTFYCLFRLKKGTVQFRMPTLRQGDPEKIGGLFHFDGLNVFRSPQVAQQVRDSQTAETQNPAPRFYLRDAGQDSDWHRLEAGKDGVYSASFAPDGQKEFELKLDSKTTECGTVFDAVKIKSLTPTDRCVTLVAAVPVPAEMTKYFDALDSSKTIEWDEVSQGRINPAGMGRLNRFPIQGVGNDSAEYWLGIDPAFPAIYRTFYNRVTNELCIAYDLGFVPENNEWELRFCHFSQEAGGLRSAWSRYMKLYPEAFKVRVSKMGVWMPFAKISEVPAHEDFGFKFMEGDTETAWDDAHNYLTFRYTEPTTWWMRLELPEGEEGENLSSEQIIDLGIAEARKIAESGKGGSYAKGWETSVMYDANQKPSGRYLDTPWCKGIVWSTCDIPGIQSPNTCEAKWSADYQERCYGKVREENDFSGVDGEYIDSSECYVTLSLNFRREHLACAKTPLTFSLKEKKPALYRGLTSFEYVHELEQKVHASNRLMMANSTPGSLSWLAPILDVMGTETDWNRNGWHPMDVRELQYRRMLCGGKPYCFLMNTDFTKFSYECSEKFMQRSLAFGMFPGYFSANASTDHYFKNPELYERDRPLFKKYVPLCKLVAEAGWEPETGVSMSSGDLLVERFGDPATDGGVYYLTVFNPTQEPIEVEFTSFRDDLKGNVDILCGEKNLGAECVMVVKITK